MRLLCGLRPSVRCTCGVFRLGNIFIVVYAVAVWRTCCPIFRQAHQTRVLRRTGKLVSQSRNLNHYHLGHAKSNAISVGVVGDDAESAYAEPSGLNLAAKHASEAVAHVAISISFTTTSRRTEICSAGPFGIDGTRKYRESQMREGGGQIPPMAARVRRQGFIRATSGNQIVCEGRFSSMVRRMRCQM